MCHACVRLAGSRLIVTLSDVRLRDLLKRYGHAMHLVEDYEPAGAFPLLAGHSGVSCEDLGYEVSPRHLVED